MKKMTARKLRIRLLRLVFIPVVFVAIFVRPQWSITSITATIIESSGYLFLLSGLAIRIWCTFYIGNCKSKKLITTGPYSICRNPLYIGTFLLAIGVGLCFENPLILLLVLAIIIPTHIITARMEEKHLDTIFGEQYRIYKQKVPGFWLRISNYNSPDVLHVNVRSIRRIALDTVGVLLLPEIEDLLETLHEQGVIPILWYLPHLPHLPHC